MKRKRYCMKKSSLKSKRRTFVKQASTVAAGITLSGNLSAPVIDPVLGANDKIRMGFIGVGNRGTQLLNRFMQNKDVDVVALCDVFEPYILRDASQIDKRITSSGRIPELKPLDDRVRRYRDFRKLLEQKDIDAVCIATPDHWHAIQTIAAIDAGKDVYVEKPLTISLREGRAMVNAHQGSNQVAAVGLNRRGSTIYQHLFQEVQNDMIGKVSFARACRISNMYPQGIGKAEPADPPKISIGICGWVHVLFGLTNSTSRPIIFDGGAITLLRWEIGVYTTWMSFVGCWVRPLP